MCKMALLYMLVCADAGNFLARIPDALTSSQRRRLKHHCPGTIEWVSSYLPLAINPSVWNIYSMRPNRSSMNEDVTKFKSGVGYFDAFGECFDGLCHKRKEDRAMQFRTLSFYSYLANAAYVEYGYLLPWETMHDMGTLIYGSVHVQDSEKKARMPFWRLLKVSENLRNVCRAASVKCPDVILLIRGTVIDDPNAHDVAIVKNSWAVEKNICGEKHEVHQGMFGAAEVLLETLREPAIFPHLNGNIAVVGHSLGGTVGTYLTLLACDTLDMHTYAFGSSPTVSRPLPARVWTVVHHSDIVPRLTSRTAACQVDCHPNRYLAGTVFLKVEDHLQHLNADDPLIARPLGELLRDPRYLSDHSMNRRTYVLNVEEVDHAFLATFFSGACRVRVRGHRAEVALVMDTVRDCSAGLVSIDAHTARYNVSTTSSYAYFPRAVSNKLSISGSNVELVFDGDYHEVGVDGMNLDYQCGRTTCPMAGCVYGVASDAIRTVCTGACTECCLDHYWTGPLRVRPSISHPATDWFLAEQEIQNVLANAGRPLETFTTGNTAEFFPDAKSYFAAIHSAIELAQFGDIIFAAGWIFNIDLSLETGTACCRTLKDLLVEACKRGVVMRILIWRNVVDEDEGHTLQMEQMRVLNGLFRRYQHPAAELSLIDHEQPLRRNLFEASHQKLWTFQYAGNRSVAFVGGIDIGHGRFESPEHRRLHVDFGFRESGRASNYQHLNTKYRTKGLNGWIEQAVKIEGPGAVDVCETFKSKWRGMVMEQHPGDSEYSLDKPAFYMPPVTPTGSDAVQVLRTFACDADGKRSRGEFSIVEGLLKAVRRATKYIFWVDQYALYVQKLNTALLAAATRGVQIVVVTNRYDANLFGSVGCHALATQMWGEMQHHENVRLKQVHGTFVHGTTVVMDDTYVFTGSANLNMRSMTSDDEIGAAIFSTEFAKSTRVRMWGEFMDVEFSSWDALDTSPALEKLQLDPKRFKDDFEISSLWMFDGSLTEFRSELCSDMEYARNAFRKCDELLPNFTKTRVGSV